MQVIVALDSEKENANITNRRVGVSLGKRVLICGAGPIGLVNLLTAQAMGASEVVITEVMDNRLEVAKTMGATHTFKVSKLQAHLLALVPTMINWQVGEGKTAEEMAVDIEMLLGGNKPDVTIECSGVEASIK